MKELVSTFAIILGISVLVGCGFGGDPSGDRSLSEEQAEVLAELKFFVSKSQDESIQLNREEVTHLLSVLGQEPSVPEKEPEKKDVIAASEPPRTLSSGTPREMVAVARPDQPALPKPVGKANAKGSAEVKDSPAIAREKPAEKPESPKKESPKEESPKEESNRGVDRVAVAKKPAGSLPVPEGFKTTIEEATTGVKLAWDASHGVWVSEEFGAYLKGSRNQSESFCWLLTSNNLGGASNSIPEGWEFRPLGDGKSIAIVEVGKKLTLEKGADSKAMDSDAPAAEAKKATAVADAPKAAKAMPAQEKPKASAAEAAPAPVVAAETKAPVSESTEMVPGSAVKPAAKPSEKPAADLAESAVKAVVESSPAAVPGNAARENSVATPAPRAAPPAPAQPTVVLMPRGAPLPDGRMLINVPSPSRNQAAPAKREVDPLRAEPVKSEQKKKEKASAEEAQEDGVPSATAKPKPRFKLTIKNPLKDRQNKSKEQQSEEGTEPNPQNVE